MQIQTTEPKGRNTPEVLLSYTTIKNDNPHMSRFTVHYTSTGNHAVVTGFSPEHRRNCRADYYMQKGVWILGAN